MLKTMRTMLALILLGLLASLGSAQVTCNKKCRDLPTGERYFWKSTEYDTKKGMGICYRYSDTFAIRLYTPQAGGGNRMPGGPTITEFRVGGCTLVCDPIAPFPQQAQGGTDLSQMDIQQATCVATP